MVNKFHYIKGGSETYYFALKRLLESEGHEVVDFSMKDEKNFPTPYADYFVENIDYNSENNLLSKVKMGMNIIYSLEAKEKLEQLIIDTKPDIAHLHIFQHQLSPSILDTLKKYNIPVVYTAHDLKMICPNYKMYIPGRNGEAGRICEQCIGGKYLNCLKNKCIKNSSVKSLINVTEAYFHKWKHTYDTIDKIITPSAFYMEKFIEFGVDPARVVPIPNFLDVKKPNINISNDKEKYFLYFGRLSEEKGIFTLIKAMKGLDTLLYVVGTGPIKEDLEKYIEDNEIKNVQLLGFKNGQELTDIVGNSKAVILPSEWYENGPYSAIEALQLGRPLIGSNLGGIPELINGNGYIYNNGEIDDLKKCLQNFNSISNYEYKLMCNKSELIFDECYGGSNHYSKIYSVYKGCFF